MSPALATTAILARSLLLLSAGYLAEASHFHHQYHRRHHRARHHHHQHQHDDFEHHHHFHHEAELAPHHRLRRHHHRHHLNLAAPKEGALNLAQEAALSLVADAPVQDVYSHPHPLVADRLETMGDGLKEVRDKEGQAINARDRLEHVQEEAMRDMSRGVVLRRLLLGAKAQAHGQAQVVAKLRDEESHLQREHDLVAHKLEVIKGPRLAAVERKLAKREKAVAKTEEKVHRLDKQRAEYKASALQTLAERTRSQAALREADEAIQEAEKREASAKQHYDVARHRVSEEVEAYKLAQERYKGIVSKSDEQKEKVVEAEASIDKTRAIFKVEGDRIDKALLRSEAKLRHRLKMAEDQRDKATRRFNATKERLVAWESEEKKMADEVSTLKKQYDNQQQDISVKRDHLLSAATDKAGEQATTRSEWNWDDWAWAGRGELGSDNTNVEDITLDSDPDAGAPAAGR